MAYKLAHSKWLEQQVLRVKGVLLQNMVEDQEYTAEELLSLLADFGLDYSNPEYVAIGQALIAEGILVQT